MKSLGSRISWFVLLLLIVAQDRAAAQQTVKLTPVNYGTITISKLHWPFSIAAQEGMLQKPVKSSGVGLAMTHFHFAPGSV